MSYPVKGKVGLPEGGGEVKGEVKGAGYERARETRLVEFPFEAIVQHLLRLMS